MNCGSLLCLTVSNLPEVNQLPTHLFNDITDISQMMNLADTIVKNACPSGIQRCECMNAPGTFSEGPFSPKDNLLGATITYLGCTPAYCFCKNNPEKEISILPQYFYSFLDLCPRNELNRCLCGDSKTAIKAPFDIISAISCHPKKCKCNGSNKGQSIQTTSVPLLFNNKPKQQLCFLINHYRTKLKNT